METRGNFDTWIENGKNLTPKGIFDVENASLNIIFNENCFNCLPREVNVTKKIGKMVNEVSFKI